MRASHLRTCLAVLFCLAARTPSWAAPQDAARPSTAAKPNIVLMFPDNLGWGEVGCYGSVRGVPTPHIDRLAEEGLKLTNFNVEYSCTVSRTALLTGRYAVRAGSTQATGMTLWEVTLAEALKQHGYRTALFGKWHVGGDNWEGQREPQDQGFDEWYGIPGTSHTAQFTSFENWDPDDEPPYIWEGKAGERSTKVKVYDMESRATVDRECAERGIGFMEQCTADGDPFLFYYPITQIHFPTMPHPDFAGKTGAGDIGDSMADVDHNVGLVLEAIDRLGIAENTIVIWCTDNGAEERRPWRGSPGPWRGFYNTAFEGGIRTPCVMRWPGHFPAEQVRDGIVHEMDLFPTLLAAAGATEFLPTDRPIDGVNQLNYFAGDEAESARDSVIFMGQGGNLMAVKWGDWKLWLAYRPQPEDADQDSTTRLFNLRSDPREETDIKDFEPGVIGAIEKVLAEFQASVDDYPHVPGNARDPYSPRGGQ